MAFHSRLAPGRCVAILGPSGSGKSTLLRAIAGLEAVEGGRISFDGKDLEGVPVHERGFGLMFQSYALFPHLTVADNVAFGLRMRNATDGEVRERVEEVLGWVGLERLGSRRVDRLSGGEQQRVALARTLAPRPPPRDARRTSRVPRPHAQTAARGRHRSTARAARRRRPVRDSRP